MEDNSILVLSSSKLVSRNNDTTFPFRQDSNFYYLTGFNEPNSVMLIKSDGTFAVKSVTFTIYQLCCFSENWGELNLLDN